MYTARTHALDPIPTVRIRIYIPTYSIGLVRNNKSKDLLTGRWPPDNNNVRWWRKKKKRKEKKKKNDREKKNTQTNASAARVMIDHDISRECVCVQCILYPRPPRVTGFILIGDYRRDLVCILHSYLHIYTYISSCSVYIDNMVSLHV